VIQAVAAPRHVLVADDNDLVRESIQAVLVRHGVKVGTAANGSEALAYLKRQRPDSVILDLFMPDKDGLETLREIRAMAPGIAVLIISGGAGDEKFLQYLAMAKKLGADAVIQKPFALDALLGLLNISRP
jgi:CheY-like chemotaxis protein